MYWILILIAVLVTAFSLSWFLSIRINWPFLSGSAVLWWYSIVFLVFICLPGAILSVECVLLIIGALARYLARMLWISTLVALLMADCRFLFLDCILDSCLFVFLAISFRLRGTMMILVRVFGLCLSFVRFGYEAYESWVLLGAVAQELEVCWNRDFWSTFKLKARAV